MGLLARITVFFIVAGGLAGMSGCMAAKRPVPPAQGASIYRVSAPLANLLACPSLTCEVVEDLRDGDQVSVTTVVPGGWVEVQALRSGAQGFMLARLLVRP